MSKKNKNILITDIEVPEIVQKKADFAFAQINREGQNSMNNEKNRKKGKKYQSIGKRFKHQAAIIIGMCILGIGTVSVAATVYHFWSRGMQGNLQATDLQQEELSEKGFSTILEEKPNYDSLAVTINGITIKPIETIVDGHFAYLSFSVEGYELEDKKEPGFESVGVYRGDNKEDENSFLNMGGSFYDGIVAGTDGTNVYDNGEALEFDEEGHLISHFLTEDGTLEYVIAAYSPNIEESLIGQTVHIEFKNLGTVYKAQYEKESGVEGNWNFALTLSGQDEAALYNIEKELGVSGAIVNSVKLSPISIKVNYSFSGETMPEEGVDEKGNPINTEMLTAPPEFCGVKLKDGTLLPYLWDGGMSGYTNDSLKEYYSLVMFDRVIDIEQVDSLLFRKAPKNEDTTLIEENLYILPIS